MKESSTILSIQYLAKSVSRDQIDGIETPPRYSQRLLVETSPLFPHPPPFPSPGRNLVSFTHEEGSRYLRALGFIYFSLREVLGIKFSKGYWVNILPLSYIDLQPLKKKS